MKRSAVPMPATVALSVAVAALLLHVFAWGLLAPAMALGPIDGLCTVAQYDDAPSSDGSSDPAGDPPAVDLRHCALTLLAQGLTAPPVPPAVVPPAAAVVAANVAAPVAADYIGWFLSTRQARGPPGLVPSRAG